MVADSSHIAASFKFVNPQKQMILPMQANATYCVQENCSIMTTKEIEFHNKMSFAKFSLFTAQENSWNSVRMHYRSERMIESIFICKRILAHPIVWIRWVRPLYFYYPHIGKHIRTASLVVARRDKSTTGAATPIHAKQAIQSATKLSINSSSANTPTEGRAAQQCRQIITYCQSTYISSKWTAKLDVIIGTFECCPWTSPTDNEAMNRINITSILWKWLPCAIVQVNFFSFKKQRISHQNINSFRNERNCGYRSTHSKGLCAL